MPNKIISRISNGRSLPDSVMRIYSLVRIRAATVNESPSLLANEADCWRRLSV